MSEMPGAKCWLTLQTIIHQLGGGFHCFLPIMIKKNGVQFTMSSCLFQ